MNNLISCKVCNGDTQLLAKKIGYDNNEYDIHACVVCGLQQIGNPPQISSLGDMYEERMIRKWEKVDFVDWKNRIISLPNQPKLDDFNEVLLKASKILQKKRLNILDVGCGRGTLVYWANKSGHIAKGLEAGKKITNFLNKKVGKYFINFHEVKDHKFDLIYFEHSFEHIDDPKKFLNHLKKSLIRKGLIFIRLPNHSCKEVKKLGFKWLNYSPPHHLFFYNRLSLNSTLLKSGFKPLFWETDCKFANGVWLFYSLDRWINGLFRRINKLPFVNLKKIEPGNHYPKSILDYFRLIPFWLKLYKPDQELSVFAQKNK